MRWVKYLLRKLTAHSDSSDNVFLSNIIYVIICLVNIFTNLRYKQDKQDSQVANDVFFKNQMLKDLSINGFHVVPDFVSGDECDELRLAIDNIISMSPKLIHPAVSNDYRLFGIENTSSKFAFFNSNKLLSDIASLYLGLDSRVAFTLGARLDWVEGGLGSGGGWHRDSSFKQFKAMVYLSDVDERTGPFQYLPKSHRFFNKLKNNTSVGKKYNNVRWSEDDIQKLIREKVDIKTFCAKKGTLIIFDSSGLHRGMPIKEKNRYAMTNYFYPKQAITPELFEHFKPVAGYKSL